MGGRRATSVAAVLGTHRSPQLERNLQQALDAEDPEKIATVSSRLAERAVKKEELDRYLGYFVPFIQNQATRAGPTSAADLRKVVRAEWSDIERREDVRLRPALRDALIQSVINYLRRSGG